MSSYADTFVYYYKKAYPDSKDEALILEIQHSLPVKVKTGLNNMGTDIEKITKLEDYLKLIKRYEERVMPGVEEKELVDPQGVAKTIAQAIRESVKEVVKEETKLVKEEVAAFSIPRNQGQRGRGFQRTGFRQNTGRNYHGDYNRGQCRVYVMKGNVNCGHCGDKSKNTQQQNQSEEMQTPMQNTERQLKCYNCQGPHLARNCHLNRHGDY